MGRVSEVVKHLIIINIIFFIAKNVFGELMYDLFAMHYPKNSTFFLWQPLSHMFMHGNMGHIFSNMIMLWFLGSAMENYWGPKRFFIYYLLTGLGASALQIGVIALEYFQLIAQLDSAAMDTILSKGADIINQGMNYTDPVRGAMNRLLHVPMVGASGAVFGVLLAFGMTFPNQVIYLNFFFPIKAKYFVIGYGLLELYNGFAVSNSGIAHFAHLGGMLFGYLLIRKWRREMYL